MKSAPSVDQSGGTIRRQAQEALELTRRHPLPASPHPKNPEPEDYARRMLRCQYPQNPVPLLTAGYTHAQAGVPENRPTVRGLLRAFRSASRTPTEVLEAYRDRWNSSPINSSAILAAVDGATEAAVDSDRRWAEGTARPLEGIPFGVKDIIDVQGAAVTCGSLQTGDRKADSDAAVVATLRAAGAIPIAMTATTEFAMGAANNARYGVVPNPWDRSRWTGGSSTGSGAGLAAGLFPFALGTDTGGSIRIPAAFCGVTGLKPTNARLPRAGVATLAWSLDHVGPMGLSAADLRLVLEVLDDPDNRPADQCSSGVEDSSKTLPLGGVVVAVFSGWHLDLVDREAEAAFDTALETLRRLGATVKDLPVPGYDAALAHAEAWNVFYGEAAATQEANLATAHLYDYGTRDRVQEGRRLQAIDYLRGLRRRAMVLDALLRAMNEADAEFLVLPTVGAGAPGIVDMNMRINGIARNTHEILPRNTRIFNYTGLPALAVPMGTTLDGLPLSLQIAGKPWRDYDVLAVGEAFQSATDFHLKMPPTHANED